MRLLGFRSDFCVRWRRRHYRRIGRKRRRRPKPGQRRGLALECAGIFSRALERRNGWRERSDDLIKKFASVRDRKNPTSFKRRGGAEDTEIRRRELHRRQARNGLAKRHAGAVAVSAWVAPTPPGFSQVLILKGVKVLCFDTLSQVLILKVFSLRAWMGCFSMRNGHVNLSTRNDEPSVKFRGSPRNSRRGTLQV